jgi:predicted flap endonuclease-1-like 5' DNA nuclease
MATNTVIFLLNASCQQLTCLFCLRIAHFVCLGYDYRSDCSIYQSTIQGEHSMTFSIVPASLWLTAALFLQTGSVPVWVPLAIILIVVLMFWWGLTRGNIPEEKETGPEHDRDHADAGQDEEEYDEEGSAGAGEVEESAAETDEGDADESNRPAQGSAEAQAAAAQSEGGSQPDDLTRIEGIGPKIASILAAAGIMSYAQLAGTSASKLEQIVREDAGIKTADPASWPQQAALAAKGDWDGLQAFQNSLIAGRHRG